VHLRARVLGVDASEISARDTVIDVPADSSMRVFFLAEPTGVSGAYFVDLRLTAADGKPISNNFYWLSTRMDVLSDSSTWYMTPVNHYADFTALRAMPNAFVDVNARFTSSGGKGQARVTLKNPSKSIAFFLRLQVTGRSGEEALPVLWEDNYLSLLPGETRVVTATYNLRDLGGGSPRVVLTGWNVRRVVAP
jgi:exo-1,4-beta-D-glucosaminidase